MLKPWPFQETMIQSTIEYMNSYSGKRLGRNKCSTYRNRKIINDRPGSSEVGQTGCSPAAIQRAPGTEL
jgi:hypothetical protein